MAQASHEQRSPSSQAEACDQGVQRLYRSRVEGRHISPLAHRRGRAVLRLSGNNFICSDAAVGLVGYEAIHIRCRDRKSFGWSSNACALSCVTKMVLCDAAVWLETEEIR